MDTRTKTCCTCKIEKDITEFNKNKKGKYGLHSRCRICTREAGKLIYKRLGKNHYLKNTYGITELDLQQMFLNQNGCCAICNTQIQLSERTKRSACVDHCHTTGRVRGLLCNHCNRGLGMFKDSKETLQKAIGYLND